MSKKFASEGSIIALLCAVQFINAVDFMMVMPLGPDFAASLGIPPSKLGWIGGSYTAAGAIAGIIASFFLDRFDRRKALFVCMLGLTVGTFLGGVANSLATLLLARVAAGIFGGPATALSMSIVADIVAPERRGRAMGTLMGAFSIASVAGVPMALELARFGRWSTPFFAVGALALVISIASFSLLPSMTKHLVKIAPLTMPAPMLRRGEVQMMFASVSVAMFSAFLMIPNISAFFQFNRGFPREYLSLLYLVGGSVSFFTMRLAGRMIDRFGNYKVAAGSAGIQMLVLFFGFAVVLEWLHPIVVFTCFMVSMSVRGVVISSIASRVPRSDERARYMSFQSAVQHVFCALGAFASTQVLSEEPNGALIGMPTLALISIAFTSLVPVFIKQVERRVLANEAHALVGG